MASVKSESQVPSTTPHAVADGALEDAIRTLAQRYLDHLEEHSEALAARMREEIAEYRTVAVSEIRSGIVAVLGVVLTRLEPRFDANQLAALDELARRAAAEGFQLDALARGIELVAREVHRTIAADAHANGIDSGAVLVMYDSAWQFASDAAARISAINKDLAVELARHDNDRRADFLRAVLYGGVAPMRIQAEAPLFGLDPARQYRPIRARPASQREEEALTLAIQRTGSSVSGRAVLALLEGELVGLAPERPVVGDELLVAVGEPCELASAPPAFEATRAALDVAAAFGHRGVVALDELGPLPLALAADDLADLLTRSHLDWLDEDSHGDRAIAETVQTLLEHDQNVEEVAKVLHVHANTVRYRLGRFRELTGLDIRRTRDLVIAWWLLARRHAARNGD